MAELMGTGLHALVQASLVSAESCGKLRNFRTEGPADWAAGSRCLQGKQACNPHPPTAGLLQPLRPGEMKKGTDSESLLT